METPPGKRQVVLTLGKIPSSPYAAPLCLVPSKQSTNRQAIVVTAITAHKAPFGCCGLEGQGWFTQWRPMKLLPRLDEALGAGGC